MTSYHCRLWLSAYLYHTIYLLYKPPWPEMAQQLNVPQSEKISLTWLPTSSVFIKYFTSWSTHTVITAHTDKLCKQRLLVRKSSLRTGKVDAASLGRKLTALTSGTLLGRARASRRVGTRVLLLSRSWASLVPRRTCTQPHGGTMIWPQDLQPATVQDYIEPEYSISDRTSVNAPVQLALNCWKHFHCIYTLTEKLRHSSI